MLEKPTFIVYQNVEENSISYIIKLPLIDIIELDFTEAEREEFKRVSRELVISEFLDVLKMIVTKIEEKERKNEKQE